MTKLKRTRLYEEHVSAGAKIVPFSGWDMPVQYESVKAESAAVRASVGVFDVSHMGEFFVTGAEAVKFVDYLLTNDFKGSEIGKAVYSPLCRDNGTIIDDLIAYKLSEEEVLICVNAGNIEKDWNWISSKAACFKCELVNKSDDYSLLALQGPNTIETLKKIGFPTEITEIDYYSVLRTNFQGKEVIAARTGYTGEDGFELFAGHEMIVNIWKLLLDAGTTPCGLAARDVLRLEVGYPLYGHELNDDVTPLDSGLKWTVKFDKDDFIGKAALKDYKPKYQLARFVLDKGIPREGYIVLNQNELELGSVCSGTMSVTLGKGIAIARIEKSKFNKEDQFFVQIRNKKYPATRITKPFVTGGHK
jgi:aminomethyltransferase